MLVALISGRGSNMQALVDAGLPLAAVISNRADAAGLEFARSRHIPSAVVDHTRFSNREAFDEALAREIDRHRPRLVALAGFMRVLTPGFVERYPEVAPHHAIMTKRVLHDRSVVMAYRMQRELRRGDAFVALGALHLYGPQGVLAQLEQDGYRAARVF